MINFEDSSRRPGPSDNTEFVDELGPGTAGRWLVTTVGSRHVWDLDLCTYQRLPGSSRSLFDHDGQVVRIGRIGAYPKVGARSLAYYDDPNDDTVEQFRISSTIRSIARLVGE